MEDEISSQNPETGDFETDGQQTIYEDKRDDNPAV